MQRVSSIVGVTAVLVIAVVAMSTVVYMAVDGVRTNLAVSSLRSFDEIWPEVGGMFVSCNGATCTINQTFWEAAVESKGFYFSLSSNIFTAMDAPSTAVAPGSTVCIETASGGEVIGFGERFYDTPPIVFYTDRTVVGDISGLMRLQVEHDPRYNLSQEDVSAFRIESTWSDRWYAYAGGRRTSSISCATKSGSFSATCTISPQVQAPEVRFVLHRSVEPFRVTGASFPVHATTYENCVRNNREKGTNIRCEEVGTATMVASVVVALDPSLPVTHCEEPVSDPTPSPSPTVTPTPTPIVTPSPTISPTSTPAPTPTGEYPTPTPTFWED